MNLIVSRISDKAITLTNGKLVDVASSLDTVTSKAGSVTVRVKEATAPLDRDRLAFAVCHPAMLRRLMFRLWEIDGRSEWKKRGGHSCYGSPIDPAPETIGDAVYLPMMMWGDDTYADPVSATKEIISRLTSR